MAGEDASVDAKGGDIGDDDDVAVLEPEVGIATFYVGLSSVVGFGVGRW